MGAWSIVNTAREQKEAASLLNKNLFGGVGLFCSDNTTSYQHSNVNVNVCEMNEITRQSGGSVSFLSCRL